MKLEHAYISNCCYANILDGDGNGQGKCSECKENCVPETDLIETSLAVETSKGVRYDIPDLSWRMVFLIIGLLFLLRLLQDNFHQLF